MNLLFEVQSNWEYKDVSISALCGQDAQCYPFVSLSSNGNIYLVDVKTETENGLDYINRYMFGSVSDAIKYLDHEKIKDSAVSLLSRRCDNNGNYDVSDLIEIIEAKDAAGQTSYVLCCKNGKRYIDSPLAYTEGELSEAKTIYYKSPVKA
jgi:hypothetical protein